VHYADAKIKKRERIVFHRQSRGEYEDGDRDSLGGRETGCAILNSLSLRDARTLSITHVSGSARSNG